MKIKTFLYFLCTVIFFVNNSLHAGGMVTPQSRHTEVRPQIGENIWQIIDRTGITIDDIQDTTTMCCSADFFITQDDINAGPITITQSGVYQLAEPISLIADSFITINASNVEFDLRGHSIDGSSTYNFYIQAGTGSSGIDSIIIKNGTLSNIGRQAGLSSPPAVIFSMRVENFIVQNINIISHQIIFTSTGTAFDFAGILTDAASSPVLIQNCQVYKGNNKGIVAQAPNCQIENCTVSFMNDFVTDVSSLFGTGFDLSGSSLIIKQCNSLSNTSYGFSISENSCILQDCSATTNGIAPGFPLIPPQYRGGIVFQSGSEGSQLYNGYTSNNTIGIVILDKNCIVSNSSSYVSVENAYGEGGYGFLCGTGSNNALIKGCTANQNNLLGFYITGSHCALQNCNAFDNIGTGFAFETGSAGSQLINSCAYQNFIGVTIFDSGCLVKNCDASNNTEHGFFGLTNSTDLQLFNSTANNNQEIGFFLQNNNCIVKGCSATNNTSHGFDIQGSFCALQECNAVANGQDGFFFEVGHNNQLLNSAAINNTSLDINNTTADFIVCDNTSTSLGHTLNGAANNNSCTQYTYITQQFIPYTISTPGNYRLAENLTSPTSNTPIITITGTSDVNLDLYGFTMSTALAGCDAIDVIDSELVNIYNGNIFNVTQNGISIDNSGQVTISGCLISACSSGIVGDIIDTISIINTIVTDATSDGIVLANGTNSVITGCESSDNIGNGFNLSTTGNEVSECTANNNVLNGFIFFGIDNIIDSSQASLNNEDGFSFSSSTSTNEISDCNSSNNVGTGVRISGNNTFVHDCVTTDNNIGYYFDLTNYNNSCCVAKGNYDSNSRQYGYLIPNLTGFTTGGFSALTGTNGASVFLIENTCVGPATGIATSTFIMKVYFDNGTSTIDTIVFPPVGVVINNFTNTLQGAPIPSPFIFAYEALYIPFLADEFNINTPFNSAGTDGANYIVCTPLS